MGSDVRLNWQGVVCVLRSARWCGGGLEIPCNVDKKVCGGHLVCC